MDRLTAGGTRVAVIRADASSSIGGGHVMRCLALAEELRDDRNEILFVCRAYAGHLAETIAARGFECRLLPVLERSETKVVKTVFPDSLTELWKSDAEETADVIGSSGLADWLIVDHYALDHRWEMAMRSHVRHIMVIDDLADRTHACDVLLDQTPGRDPEAYAELVPKGCHVFGGARYALLRREFAEKRAQMNLRLGRSVGRVLVAMGSMDPENVTSTILEALDRCEHSVTVDVVLSSQAMQLEIVRARAAACRMPVEVRADVADMAGLMARADLAVGASGATALERCALGLPAITLITAENQRLMDANLVAAGAVRSLGWFEDVSVDALTQTLDELIADSGRRALLSRNAWNLVDGRGAGRVVQRMRECFDA